MKPTVIASSAAGGGGAPTANAAASNGMNIPINQEYATHPHAYPHPHQQQPTSAYGSPGSYARQQQQQPHQQPSHQQQQQIPAHFQQGFGFEPDMDIDMDMFPRSRLGRMHDPFAGFSGSHFGFPQFGSLGRRRAAADDNDDDIFNRLPSEFRHYIPDNFGHRRAGSGGMAPQQQQPQQQQMPPQAQYYQHYVPTDTTPPSGGMPQPSSKKLCDAAIQTEDPSGRSEVDSAAPAMQTDHLNQHGYRNTVDMGVKSAAENEQHGLRSQSAPPNEQQQQQMPVNGKRPSPPPQAGHAQQFGTQTSPQTHAAGGQQHQQPQFNKAYYAPQHQAHPQQKQQTPPPPQTPGGTYVRTIPIFVEGRSEPIINSHKEIPNQNAAATNTQYTPQQQQPHHAQQQQYYQQHPPQQQQHRPTPFNTQQQGGQQPQQEQASGLPPQTPHTLDSINKIQDIQRDVLDLMGRVEKFTGTRKDKSYAYLDEMLTRNLLKLDTIDTNGKDSIRLARKEAIKCIQASINVLEAKAEENAKTAQGADVALQNPSASESGEEAGSTSKSSSKGEVTKEAEETGATGSAARNAELASQHEPIPLPPPEGMSAPQAENGQPQKSLSQTSNNAAESQAQPHQKEASPIMGECIASSEVLDSK